MVSLTSAIYDPPEPQLPHLVVFFDGEGDVRVIRAVDSRPDGMALLEKIAENVADLGLLEFRVVTQPHARG
jgi:hypothetical protein